MCVPVYTYNGGASFCPFRAAENRELILGALSPLGTLGNGITGGEGQLASKGKQYACT